MHPCLLQRDPAFEAAIRQAAGELGLEADEEFVKNVVSLRCGRCRGFRHARHLPGSLSHLSTTAPL